MKKSQETKRCLIDSTKILLKQAKAITIKDICDNAEVNSAAVNYHFGDKEALISIAINEILDGLKAQITDKLSGALPSDEETLLMFLDLVYNFSVDNIGVLSYMFSFSDASGDNKFLDTFLRDTSFTAIVFQRIDGMSDTKNSPEANAAKFMALFSTFLMPMFCEYGMMKYGWHMELGKYSLQNSEFRKHYLIQLYKILKA